MKLSSNRDGFTLAELMVAAVMGAFVALSVVSIMRVVSSGREKIEQGISISDQMRFAADMIRTDLANLYRDRDNQHVMLVGTTEESEFGPAAVLTIYTVNTVKARFDQPEGDVYEVEYKLLRKQEKSVLLRRLWPNPDKDSEPGGVLTEIANNIVVFDIKYFDGDEWLDEWPEESEALPELIEVNITAELPGQKNVLSKTFMVNLAPLPSKMDSSSVNSGQENKQNR